MVRWLQQRLHVSDSVFFCHYDQYLKGGRFLVHAFSLWLAVTIAFRPTVREKHHG